MAAHMRAIRRAIRAGTHHCAFIVVWIVGRQTNTFVTVDMHSIECFLRTNKPQLPLAFDHAATVYVTSISSGSKAAFLRQLTICGWFFRQQNSLLAFALFTFLRIVHQPMNVYKKPLKKYEKALIQRQSTIISPRWTGNCMRRSHLSRQSRTDLKVILLFPRDKPCFSEVLSSY